MDVEDDLVALPDAKGALDLSNRSWVRLDATLWTMGRLLLDLNISYNRILVLPPEIGNLEMLRFLDASFNKIQELPPEIGKLQRLRELNMSGNCLKEVPEEISMLSVLDVLNLSENSIEQLPVSITQLKCIRQVFLNKNRLRSIPIELPLLPTLESVDLSGNPHLEIIPTEWSGSIVSVRLVCTMHKNYQDQINDLVRSATESTVHLQQLETDQLLMEEMIAALKYEVNELGKSVYKTTRKRIASAARIHASKGSVRRDGQEVGEGFPAMDDPMMYADDDEDGLNRNSVGQRLINLCCLS